MQGHCNCITLLKLLFLNVFYVYIANVSKVNPPKHAQNFTFIALEDQKQSVCVSGKSWTTTSRRRANDVSQTHSLTSLKADMKLGRSWQAQADRRQRGERGFPKLCGSMFCILGPAEGFTGHKSAFARLGIIYSSGRGPFDLGCRRTLHQQSLSRSTPLSRASLSEDSVCHKSISVHAAGGLP